MKKTTPFSLKLLITVAFITSFIGYLQWGVSEREFVFQTEFNLLSKLPHDWAAFKHPFVLLPFLGQILLLVAIFQKTPSRILTYTAIGMIGLLYLMILLVGCLGAGFLTVISALPFLISGCILIRYLRKINTRSWDPNQASL